MKTQKSIAFVTKRLKKNMLKIKNAIKLGATVVIQVNIEV